MFPGTIRPHIMNDLILKFNHKADIHEEWSKDKEQTLICHEFRVCCLNGVKELKKKHEIFALDLESHRNRVQQIVANAQELSSFDYSDQISINSRCQTICFNWDRLLILTRQRTIALKKAEEVHRKINDLHLEFAKRVVLFDNWLDSTLQDLMDVFIVEIMRNHQKLRTDCSSFTAKILEAKNEYFAILSITQEIDSIASQFQIYETIDNPYTCLTAQEISEKYYKLKKFIPKADQTSQENYQMERTRDNLCRLFAGKANIIGHWIERQTNSMVNISMDTNITIEDQFFKLTECQMRTKNYRPHMESLEDINRVIDKEQIRGNPYTHYTFEMLCNGWHQLVISITKNIKEVHKMIEIRDSKDIKIEALKRFRISFNQFVDNITGKMNDKQLKSCLKSLEFNFSDESPYIGCDFHEVMNKLDPNNTGFVSFDAFLDFVTDDEWVYRSLYLIIDSFRILSSNKVYITAEDLRQFLDPKVAEYCIKRMKAFTGSDGVPDALDYMSFSQTLYERDQSFRRKSVTQDMIDGKPLPQTQQIND